MRLYAAFGNTTAAAVPFELHPAVWKGGSSCIDETGCDYEKVTLCAFAECNSTADKVRFLECMDSQAGGASASAHACAGQLAGGASGGAGGVTERIDACFNGQQGADLLEAASAWCESAEIGGVPHVTVDGQAVAPDYDDIAKAVCAGAGRAASPACTAPAPAPSGASYRCEFFRGKCVADASGKYASAAECEQKCG